MSCPVATPLPPHRLPGATPSTKEGHTTDLPPVVCEASDLIQRVFENSEDCVVTLELSGAITSANPASRHFLETDDIQPFIGSSWFDLWQGEYRFMAEDAVAAAAGGALGSFEGFRRTAVTGPRWWDVTVAVAVNIGGRAERLLVVARDMTDRKQSEEALRQQKEMVDRLISIIPGHVFWKNRDGVYLGCNQTFARAGGFADPRDVVGKTDHDMPWAPEEIERCVALDHQVVRGGLPLENIEGTHRRVDGSQIHVVESRVPVRDAGGAVVGILGVFTDITERKRAEEKLKEETLVSETLNRVGRALAAELDLRRLVQAATDAATEVARASSARSFTMTKDRSPAAARRTRRLAPIATATMRPPRPGTRPCSKRRSAGPSSSA